MRIPNTIYVVLLFVFCIGCCNIKKTQSLNANNKIDSIRIANEMEILKKYVKFNNNLWEITISPQEANELGVSNDVFEMMINNKNKINRSIDSVLRNNPNAKFNVNNW